MASPKKKDIDKNTKDVQPKKLPYLLAIIDVYPPSTKQKRTQNDLKWCPKKTSSQKKKKTLQKNCPNELSKSPMGLYNFPASQFYTGFLYNLQWTKTQNPGSSSFSPHQAEREAYAQAKDRATRTAVKMATEVGETGERASVGVFVWSMWEWCSICVLFVGFVGFCAFFPMFCPVFFCLETVGGSDMKIGFALDFNQKSSHATWAFPNPKNDQTADARRVATQAAQKRIDEDIERQVKEYTEAQGYWVMIQVVQDCLEETCKQQQQQQQEEHHHQQQHQFLLTPTLPFLSWLPRPHTKTPMMAPRAPWGPSWRAGEDRLRRCGEQHRRAEEVSPGWVPKVSSMERWTWISCEFGWNWFWLKCFWE